MWTKCQRLLGFGVYWIVLQTAVIERYLLSKSSMTKYKLVSSNDSGFWRTEALMTLCIAYAFLKEVDMEDIDVEFSYLALASKQAKISIKVPFSLYHHRWSDGGKVRRTIFVRCHWDCIASGVGWTTGQVSFGGDENKDLELSGYFEYFAKVLATQHADRPSLTVSVFEWVQEQGLLEPYTFSKSDIDVLLRHFFKEDKKTFNPSVWAIIKMYPMESAFAVADYMRVGC